MPYFPVVREAVATRQVVAPPNPANDLLGDDPQAGLYVPGWMVALFGIVVPTLVVYAGIKAMKSNEKKKEG